MMFLAWNSVLGGVFGFAFLCRANNVINDPGQRRWLPSRVRCPRRRFPARLKITSQHLEALRGRGAGVSAQSTSLALKIDANCW